MWVGRDFLRRFLFMVCFAYFFNHIYQVQKNQLFYSLLWTTGLGIIGFAMTALGIAMLKRRDRS